jgi:hypothetical protein
MSRYWQPTYTRQDGTVVRGHWVNDSRTRRDTEVPAASRPTPYEPSTYPPPTPAYSPPPSPASHAASRPRKKKRKAAIAITAAAVVTAGAVTLTLTGGGSAGASDNISVQTTVNFNQVMTELPKLGFAGVVTQNATSDSSQNCSQASTGEVQEFFANNPCKEFAVTVAKLHNEQIATQAVITWVVMPTVALTLKYKNLVDLRYTGNPPGQSTNFDGLCYASGVNGNSAWAAQVQPTGHIFVDQQILQAVVPVKLSASYLADHCIG